jgi:hypothetical protein
MNISAIGQKGHKILQTPIKTILSAPIKWAVRRVNPPYSMKEKTWNSF